MKTSEVSSTPDLERLLEHGRSVRPLPELVRARALSRARKVARTPVSLVPPRAGKAAYAGRAAMAAALALGIVGAAFALGQSLRGQPAAAPAASVVRSQPASIAPAPSSAPAPSEVSPECSTCGAERTSSGARPAARAATSSGNVDSESALMRRAHSAYAERNFGNALRLVAEHAKKYPRGVLAEEREALRVRSLASAGQTAESRRGAAALAQRFPRSVLLPRIRAFAAPDATTNR